MIDEEKRTQAVKDEYAVYNRRLVEKEVEPPPFFKTWNGLYAFVLGFLVFLIVCFYIFTKMYE